MIVHHDSRLSMSRNRKFNRISFGETPKILLLAWEKFSKIQHAKPEDIQELLHQLLKDLQIISKELSEFINCPSWNRPTFYDNDDEEYSIQFKEYLENSSKAITPDLPTEELDIENLVPIPREPEGVSDDTCDMPFCDNSPPLDVLNDHFEIFSDYNDDCTLSDNDSFENIDYVKASPPEDSLIMGNEELGTIPKKESDEFINSSAEDLVPIPSESKGTSVNDSKSVSPSSDDFSPISIFEEKSVTYSNPLFDLNDDFTSSDDESLSDEDVLENNVKIYSNPLFEFNDGYISSDVNPLFDEVNEDKCFDPRGGEIVFSPNVKDEDSFTFFIQTFLPFLTYPVDSPLLLSTRSEDTIFDSGIS
ncbi:hypothetical protein Tco_0557283, partial [Tanacetum coccineum]